MFEIVNGKSMLSYEKEINHIRTFIKNVSQYYLIKKLENTAWAETCDKRLFRKVYDKKNNNISFRCKVCGHKINKIPVYKETLHNDEYIKCPHCWTSKYLYPEKIAERLNKNLDIEFKQFKEQQIAKLKKLELNYKYLTEKEGENKVAYYIEETNHKTD